MRGFKGERFDCFSQSNTFSKSVYVSMNFIINNYYNYTFINNKRLTLSSALNIEQFLNDYVVSPDLILANDVLRVITYFSNLIEIFGEGMLTYNMERYKQLAKRLGRLIRHTLQYSSDYYDLFM